MNNIQTLGVVSAKVNGSDVIGYLGDVPIYDKVSVGELIFEYYGIANGIRGIETLFLNIGGVIYTQQTV